MKKLFVLLAMVALSATACSKLKADDAATVASDRLAKMMTGFGKASQAVNQVSAVDDMGSSMSAMDTAFASAPISGSTAPETGGLTGEDCVCPAPPPCKPPPPDADGGTPDYGDAGYRCPDPVPCDCSGSGSSSGVPTEAQWDEMNQTISKFLKERIMTEDNLEDTSGSSATFKVDGADVCRGPDGRGMPDARCESDFDKSEFRVRATEVSDEQLDVTILVGPDKYEPVTFQLRDDSIATVTNLEQLKLSIEHVARVTNSTANMPKVMKGIVSMMVQKNGEQDFSLIAAIATQVQIEVEENGLTRTVKTAARNPLAVARVEALTKKLTVSVDVGETEVSVPYNPDVFSTGSTTARMVYHLSGLSFAFTAQEGQQDGNIAHIGIGDAQSWVKMDNTTVFSADLNQLSGRHFDLKMTKQTGGLPLIEVIPEFDLVAKFLFNPMKADWGYDYPSFYDDETYTVSLKGSGSAKITPVEGTETTKGGLKVVKGTLKLGSNKGPTLEVPEGKCLTGAVPDATAHQLLGHFAVGDCP